MSTLLHDAPARLQPPSRDFRFLCVILAVLPFQSIYLVHYFRPCGSQPTGFIQGDMPYYCANGRAVFERGNGLAHPNPYDPDPQAPVIYFHWITWLLGIGITRLGIDPGACFVGLGVVGSLACAWFTFRLIEGVLPDPRLRTLLYFLVMWGGGILCLGPLLAHGLTTIGSSAGTASGPPDLFTLDPFDGWWFLNWGRNLVYPTEAVYHAIVAGTWLAVLARRWVGAVVGTALLAATHPFSGLQLLLMVLGWLSWRLWRDHSGRLIVPWLIVSGLLCLFLAYYLGFLESFSAHRALRQTWSLEWTLPISTMAFAYGPLALLAGCRWRRGRPPFYERDEFFALCLLVSVLLAKHDWLVQPRQPLHFTRGYIWMPLCLLALPAVQSGLLSLRQRSGRRTWVLALVVLIGLAVFDNAAFVSREVQRHWQEPDRAGYRLRPEEREVFAWLEAQGFRGVLLTSDERLSYLAAVYCSARPYYGHWANTPDFQARLARVRAGEVPAEVDYYLETPADDRRPNPATKGWACVFDRAGYRLWVRPLAE